MYDGSMLGEMNKNIPFFQEMKRKTKNKQKRNKEGRLKDQKYIYPLSYFSCIANVLLIFGFDKVRTRKTPQI